MKEQRIAIIGAGVVGLYLSWRLQQEGFEVTVFEKRDKVGLKPCTSLISERIRKFIPIPDSLYQRKVESVLVHFPKKDIKLKPRPSFLVFERKEIDEFVFNLAQQARAKFVFQKEITEMPEGFARVIGCDGALSRIREFLSLPSPNFRLGIQYFVKMNSPLSEIEIWPKIFNGSPRYGFFWKIPKTGKIEYGAIGPKGLVKEEFERFCQKQNIIVDSRQLKAALIPQGICLPRSRASSLRGIPNSGNITLCGDAAGLTKPTTGGGVIWGLTAANILIKHFPDFRKYKKEAERFFKPKILKGKAEVSLGYFVGQHFPFLLPKNISIEADLF